VKFRVGFGFDLHRLGPSSHLILGGVHIPHTKGLIGHSDGDVLCHAIVDALLGAAALGNIGQLFPDTDPRYKGMSSLKFLTEAVNLLWQNGFQIENIDASILAEKPKLLPHFPAMREAMAAAAGIPVEKIFVKAKTMEGVGEIGTEEAIAAHAVALVSTSEANAGPGET
jgi:2-C-methyl-D-erythritol 2,4-cyclodiphosphate synthase